MIKSVQKKKQMQGSLKNGSQNRQKCTSLSSLQMKIDNSPLIIQQKQTLSSLQKKNSDEEQLLQGQFVTQLKEGLEEEEPVQGKVIQQVVEEEEPLQGKSIQKKNKTGMPDNLKSGIEHLSGIDVSDVRVHYNSSKPASVQAHAYAQGTDIHVASGQEKHLPHEAWHVVQQKQGRVKPTTEVAGMPVNDNQALEKEADVMGSVAKNRVQ